MENLTTEQIKEMSIEAQLAYRLARRGLRLASAGAGEQGWYAPVTTWYEGTWASERYWVTDLEDGEQLPETDMDGLTYPSPDPTSEEQAAFERYREEGSELAQALTSHNPVWAIRQLAESSYGWRKAAGYLDQAAILFGSGVYVEIWLVGHTIDRVVVCQYRQETAVIVPGSEVHSLPREGDALEMGWAYLDDQNRDHSGSYPRNQ